MAEHVSHSHASRSHEVNTTFFYVDEGEHELTICCNRVRGVGR
jgi:hypothetical protein